MSPDSPESDLDRLDRSVLIEIHPVDADFPVIPVCGVQRPSVVDDVVIVCPGDVDNRMMPCSCGHFGILLEDLVTSKTKSTVS